MSMVLKKGWKMFFEDSCIFAEFPLDPSDHLRGDEKLMAKLKADRSSKFIGFRNGEALVNDAHNIHFLSSEETDNTSIFLGIKEEVAYFAVEILEDFQLPKNTIFLDMRTIAKEVAIDGFSRHPSMLARGKMLLDWHSRHQFCANCGNMSEMRKGGYVRHCQKCETDHFPRVDPVVIMMVIYKDKCLLGRSPHFPPGMYSALAGFMEPGETIEEACRREVLEEAGIKVGDVKYIKSQPWPFPSSLMIGVIADALNDDINIENDELEDAKWFDKKTIIQALEKGGDDNFRVPDKLAIARHLLEVHMMAKWASD
jgi:NAD+ diphosphatase